MTLDLLNRIAGVDDSPSEETQPTAKKSAAEMAVDEGYLPETYGYGPLTSAVASADVFGLFPTTSRNYRNEEIESYLDANPTLLENAIGGQPEGIRQVLAEEKQSQGRVQFFKSLVRAKYLSAPKEVFDVAEEEQLRQQDPTFFGANQKRINTLHATADYSQRRVNGKQVSIFNPNDSFLGKGQRYALASLTGEQRKNYLETTFNAENGFKVLEVPNTLDKDGQVLAGEFLIQRLDDKGLPVEVRRVDPFGDEAALRSGGREIVQNFAELVTTEEGRKDLAEVLGTLVNEKVLAENAVYAAGLAMGGGLPLFGKVLMAGIGAPSAQVATNLIFQKLGEFFRSGNFKTSVDIEEAIFSGIGAVAGSFVDFVRPYVGSLKAQLVKTKKADREGVIEASERLDIPLNLQTLSNNPFLQRIITQAGQLRPSKFNDIRLEAEPKIKAKLDKKGDIQTEVITPQNFNNIIAREKRDLLQNLSGMARYDFTEITDPEVQIGAPTARLALEKLSNFQTNMKSLRNTMYKNALKGAPDVEVDFTDALDNYNTLLDQARKKAPARFVGTDKEVDTGIVDAAGKPTTRVQSDGTQESTLGAIPKELDDLAEQIGNLQPIMTSTQVGEDVFPALEQMYNLKRRFNAKLYRLAKEDEGGALLERMRPVEEALDNMMETIIERAPANVKNQLEAGNSVARLISDLPIVDFYADALFAGDRNAFTTLTTNLLSNPGVLKENVRTLFYDIANAVAIKNRTAKRAGAVSSELAETSFADFKNLVGESAIVGLAADSRQFLTRLGNLMGGGEIKNLSDLADIKDNANLKFLFTDDQIQTLVKNAENTISGNNSLAKLTAAGLTKDSSTRDIIRELASKVDAPGGTDAGIKQLKQILPNFEAAKPQLRAFIFDDLLQKAAPDGEINFAQLRKSIDALKNGEGEKGIALREIYNFAFTDAKGDMVDGQLLDDIQLIAGRLAENVSDAGADIATGAEAGKVAKGSIVTNPKVAIDFLKKYVIAGHIANFVTKPIEAKRVAAIAKEVDSPITKQKLLKTLVNYSFSTSMQNRDIDFYTLDTNAEGFQENPKLQKALNLISRSEREVIKERRRGFKQDSGIFDFIESQIGLRGEQGDDVLTGSNVTLPTVQSAPIPPARTGLNIPAAPTTGGQGIAGLASPATVQQLAQVGLPLFGGSSGPR